MMTLTRHKRLYISLFLSIRMVTFQNSPSVALHVCKWNHKTDCSMSFYQNNKTTCQQNSRTVDHASSHSALIALNQYKKPHSKSQFRNFLTQAQYMWLSLRSLHIFLSIMAGPVTCLFTFLKPLSGTASLRQP